MGQPDTAKIARATYLLAISHLPLAKGVLLAPPLVNGMSTRSDRSAVTGVVITPHPGYLLRISNIASIVLRRSAGFITASH